MIKTISEKVFKVVFFLFLLSIFSFLIVKLAPGDPTMSMLRIDDIAATKEEIANLKAQLGYDKPLLIQYFIWLSHVVRLDFGNSLITGQPAINTLLDAIPPTLEIMLGSVIVTIIISLPLGIISALNPKGIINKISEVFVAVGSSMPAFFIGFLLVELFCVKLRILPSMGMGGIEYMILPSVTLGISMAPLYVKVIKSSIMESKSKDFIKSAKARGIYSKRIFLFHILRNSLIPIITVFGLSLGYLMGGTVIIEVLFSYSGVGQLAMQAITKRDYSVIQAFILFTGICVFVINRIVDISYKFIDPSIRIKGGE